jgi:hypothetical protein
VRVNVGLDVAEQGGCVLHFVDDDRRREALQELGRSRLGHFRLARGVERNVAELGKVMLQQRGLADLARAHQRHHREAGGELAQFVGERLS